MQLLADGKAYGEAVTLNAENGWSHTWTELPEKQSGKEVTYTVEEIGEITGYTKGYSADSFTITNTHKPEAIVISGSKTWNDNDNQDGVRPVSIKINLFADGALKESKTVIEADGWSWNFDNLPKYKDGGAEIIYTITEDAVGGYTTEISGYNATNTHEPETTSVSGSKTWNKYISLMNLLVVLWMVDVILMDFIKH